MGVGAAAAGGTAVGAIPGTGSVGNSIVSGETASGAAEVGTASGAIAGSLGDPKGRADGEGAAAAGGGTIAPGLTASPALGIGGRKVKVRSGSGTYRIAPRPRAISRPRSLMVCRTIVRDRSPTKNSYISSLEAARPFLASVTRRFPAFAENLRRPTSSRVAFSICHRLVVPLLSIR